MNKETLEELAKLHINDKSRSGENYCERDLERMIDFKAGFKAALELPEAKALVEALEFYANPDNKTFCKTDYEHVARKALAQFKKFKEMK